ncbi:hypothetical protein BJX99DRAFT_255654 [Aspergillus californicus]
MRLLLSLAWLALSASANVSSAGDTDSPQLEQRTAHLAKRSRPKCGPKLALSTDTVSLSLSTSRNSSLGFIRFERNGSSPNPAPAAAPVHLGKRMELPDHSLGAFYDKEMPRLTEPIGPYFDGTSAEDMSTAVLKTFSSVGRRKQYSTGTEGLCGCTTMYIISRKAVYAPHWWENVSFDPDNDWREDGRTNDQIFESTVLDMLTDGGRFHPRLDAELIEDTHIMAYLKHPSQTWKEEAGDVGYPERWEAIRKTVGELVPTSQDAGRWTDIPYKALDNDDDAFSDEEATVGRNLFKFDPLHIFGPGVTGPLAKLWVEDRLVPYHDDQW